MDHYRNSKYSLIFTFTDHIILSFCLSCQILAHLMRYSGLPTLTRTEEGNEEQFAANYLGPFLLTNLLLGMYRRFQH